MVIKKFEEKLQQLVLMNFVITVIFCNKLTHFVITIANCNKTVAFYHKQPETFF